ncbi:GNAT family N-acetyltransferase [Burkholderia sp. BCC1977]|uniref:GNAT family N-acetyltransferase n=1 Tax=Burkholderia sp. BCC1977 TaxID=2817440 RepID=UPI002ABE5883|nr:GNAT family N-acetyltransferase [Burkholderia sp. BCC1977]
MSLEYRQEEFDSAWPDIAAMLPLHWREISSGKQPDPSGVVRLASGHYRQIACEGRLCIVTARAAGVLAGYYVSTVSDAPLLGERRAYTDFFYLHPVYRGGFEGQRLIAAAECALRSRGVQMLVIGTANAELGGALEGLGYRPIERVYGKRP